MILYVAVGSAIGGVARYLLGTAIAPRGNGVFPWGTLAINVVGSMLAGFLVRWFAEGTAMSPEIRTLLVVGVCGGFTTFSAFSVEGVRLLEQGYTRQAVSYAAASVVLAGLAAWVGMALARGMLAPR